MRLIPILAAILLTISTATAVHAEEEDRVQDPMRETSPGVGPNTRIGTVDLSVVNRSGYLNLTFEVRGTSSPGTDLVKVAWASYNGSGEFLGAYWIEPIDAIF